MCWSIFGRWVQTYKEAGKHILFGIIDRPFVEFFVMLFGYERLTGVLDVIVVEAAVEAAGRLVTVKTLFQITRVTAGRLGGGGGARKRNHWRSLESSEK